MYSYRFKSTHPLILMELSCVAVYPKLERLYIEGLNWLIINFYHTLYIRKHYIITIVDVQSI
jgi:hypothetical protein